MERCVYCGKILSKKCVKAKAHMREFWVCDDECKKETEKYVKLDKKYKLTMYLMIFVGGIGFMISALFGSGAHMMFGAYIGQIIAGVAFLIFPYPIISFETFMTTSIRTVKRISRLIGAGFIVWGIMLFIL